MNIKSVKPSFKRTKNTKSDFTLINKRTQSTLREQQKLTNELFDKTSSDPKKQKKLYRNNSQPEFSGQPSIVNENTENESLNIQATLRPQSAINFASKLSKTTVLHKRQKSGCKQWKNEYKISSLVSQNFSLSQCNRELTDLKRIPSGRSGSKRPETATLKMRSVPSGPLTHRPVSAFM